MAEYDVIKSCNKCGGVNKTKRESFTEGHLSEAYTECDDCGFEDFWAYGHFESGTEMKGKCEKYYT